jgi:mitochondrial inner membrane protease ATP23
MSSSSPPSTTPPIDPQNQDRTQEQPNARPPQPPNTRKGGTAEFLTGTDSWTRFRNFYRMASGAMSPRGQQAYWYDVDLRYESTDCRRCETQRDDLLKHSPIIRFLHSNIHQLGGRLDKSNIRCRRCEPHERMFGGFDPRFGIKLCANLLEGRSRIEDTMAHEMVHAWDHLRWKVDWHAEGGNLKAVACTEVRMYHPAPTLP